MELVNNEIKPYGPIIKHKGFNPKPVAGRIPIYADSISNPKCVGTSAWEEFWLEQIYYCLHGYDTGGIHISGRYYNYLNFFPIKGLQGTIYPDFIDLHYQLFDTVDYIKKNHIPGLLLPKARRKGLSIFGTALGSHGARFVPDYRMGVAGGLERYVDGFRIKLYSSFNNGPPELKMNILKKNDKELKIGWEEKNTFGEFDEKVIALGMFATMNDQATKFEGEFLHDVFAEESGQFELLKEFHESVKPALELGELTIGTFYIYGTGGNMQKGSKAFMEMWHQYESYGFIRFFISGSRYYFPYYGGARDETGMLVEKIPNILLNNKKLSPEQYLGCEDVIAAEQKIREERIKRAKNPDKKVLIEWNKKYPLTIEEVFTSSGSNNFNNELLYDQVFKVQSDPQKWKEYVFEFVKTKDGNIEIPLKVNMIPYNPLKHKEWQSVEILEMPKPNIKDLDVIGVDGYNEDQTTTTESLGGIIGLRRYDTFKSEYYPPVRLPIIRYLKRPPRKEQFFEIALMISVAYNTLKNTMISAESDICIDHFKKNYGKKFLSPRPRSFDAPDGQLQHEFGAKMTPYSKPRMVSLIQTFVEDNCSFIFFLNLLYNLITYDEENIGNDWDDVDGLGLALMRIVDMKRIPVDSSQEDINKDFDLPVFNDDNGFLIDQNDRRIDKKDDPYADLWIGEKYEIKSKRIISDLD